MANLWPVINARFGSLADLQCNTSLMSALGCKAVIGKPFFGDSKLKVRFSRKRSFGRWDLVDFEGPLSAKSRRLGYEYRLDKLRERVV